jgi:ABC-type uncharacterized transport system involved in gliding motility auxiliary subunit
MKPAAEPADTKGDGAEAQRDRKGYLIVAGDSDFASNTYFDLSGNGDFFLNMVNYMSEDENLITIKPREKPGQVVLLTEGQGRLLFWLVLVLVPLVVLLAGFTVYYARRSRR